MISKDDNCFYCVFSDIILFGLPPTLIRFLSRVFISIRFSVIPCSVWQKSSFPDPRPLRSVRARGRVQRLDRRLRGSQSVVPIKLEARRERGADGHVAEGGAPTWIKRARI